METGGGDRWDGPIRLVPLPQLYTRRATDRSSERPTTMTAIDTSYQGISPRFGDTIDEIALSFPISRARLVDAIDRFDTTVRRQEDYVRRQGTVVVKPSAILVDLPISTWLDVEASADLLPFEAVAIRMTHDRLATSILGAESQQPRQNLLVLSIAAAGY